MTLARARFAYATEMVRLSSVGLGAALLLIGACSGDEFAPTAGASGAGGGLGGAGEGGSTGAAAGMNAAAGAGGSPEAGAGGGGAFAGGGTAGGGDGAAAGGGGEGGQGGQDGAGMGGAQQGGAAGSPSGSAGAGGLNVGGANGGAGAVGGAGGAGVAGAAGATGCGKPASCGDQILQDGEACDITSCQDKWCSSTCKETLAATLSKASEICRDGICWMIVARARAQRAGAIDECTALDGEGRSWRPGYWLNAAELATLTAVAGYRLEGAANDAMWLFPSFVQGAGWTQPGLAKPDPPPIGGSKTAAGLRIVLGADGVLKLVPTVHDDPVLENQGWVLCRADP